MALITKMITFLTEAPWGHKKDFDFTEFSPQPSQSNMS